MHNQMFLETRKPSKSLRTERTGMCISFRMHKLDLEKQILNYIHFHAMYCTTWGKCVSVQSSYMILQILQILIFPATNVTDELTGFLKEVCDLMSFECCFSNKALPTLLATFDLSMLSGNVTIQFVPPINEESVLSLSSNSTQRGFSCIFHSVPRILLVTRGAFKGAVSRVGSGQVRGEGVLSSKGAGTLVAFVGWGWELMRFFVS